MPNPDTITVVSESKYSCSFINASVFIGCPFPSQSKLQLYSHNSDFLFQNVTTFYNCNFISHFFYISQLQLYFFQTVTLYLTVVTLFLIAFHNVSLFLPILLFFYQCRNCNFHNNCNTIWRCILCFSLMQLYRNVTLAMWRHLTFYLTIATLWDNKNLQRKKVTIRRHIVTLHFVLCNTISQCDFVPCYVTMTYNPTITFSFFTLRCFSTCTVTECTFVLST